MIYINIYITHIIYVYIYICTHVNTYIPDVCIQRHHPWPKKTPKKQTNFSEVRPLHTLLGRLVRGAWGGPFPRGSCV